MLVNPYALGGGGGGGPATDPDFASVVALLHFNGADGDQVYTDVTGRIWTQGSGTTSCIATAQSIFGGASYENDNGSSRSGWIDTPSSSGFAFGTGELTVEAFVYPTNAGGTNFLYDARGGNGIILAVVGGALWIFCAGGVRINAGVVVNNAWQHLAYTRVGVGGSAVGRGFIDGVSVGTWNDATNYGPSDCVIGAPTDARGSFRFRGLVDDLRVTNGVARYTSSFTPIGPFPDIGSGDPMNDEFNGASLDAKWTWRQQASATAIVSSGVLTMTADPATADPLVQQIYQPFSGIATFRTRIAAHASVNFAVVGLHLRNSASGRVSIYGFHNQSARKIAVIRFNSESSYSSSVFTAPDPDPDNFLFLEVEVTSTDIFYRTSPDGSAWTLQFSETLAAFMVAPDEVGFAVCKFGASTPYIEADWFRKV